MRSAPIVLKARALPLYKSKQFDTPKRQEFVSWDGEEWLKWIDDDFEKNLKEGVVREIQLQPLKLSVESISDIEELCDRGATGTSIYRQFWWNRNLKWEEDKNRRITWKIDRKSMPERVYVTFDEGEWIGDDGDLKFISDGETNDLSGACLSGLKLRMKGDPELGNGLPTELDYTACDGCRFDGIQKMTSFRGAHLQDAIFCGRSTLRECDFSSTNCSGVRFDYPNILVDEDCNGEDGTFKSTVFKGAFVDGAKFNFRTANDPQRGKAAQPIVTAKYGINKCCKNGDWIADLVDGMRAFFFFLFVSLFRARETLLKHKQEIEYLLSELDRLRKYEVTKDNWQEMLDSWTTLGEMPLQTQKAQEVRDELFETESSKDLLFTGKVLYMIEDEPPLGLLTDMKKLIGEKLLRNMDFMKKKACLTDELASLDVILGLKDQITVIVQNFILGIFILGANIGADIISETWGYDFLEIFGIGGEPEAVVAV
eukprot:CAMPEP_0116126504 /NCGR_PEP_ID=MMETSP0329-20121206/6365_1 /TAXON_ID=697910 /ORGANISM="Pseudo-nitzschia arenysensis, Strain B593" /LENGTH=483 /DNA_ID=CAMNT_0003620587 /DNA_START=44 /DNA_END=1495 /DNA_ORIENTATION=-